MRIYDRITFLQIMSYFKRQLESKLLEYITLFPVVGITGPRQSGKSTLLLHTLKDYIYVTFDDYKNLTFFQDDPDGFIQQYNDRVIFDEIQRVPELFSQIKIAVDNDRQNYGKFVVTGSSQFVFHKNISESLAGRIGLLSMLPLQFSEMPEQSRDQSIYSGAYPELVTRDYRGSDAWYSSYLDTYLMKDVRELIHVGDMRDFQRLIELLAANTSQVLNMTTYAKEIGVTVQTIKRWISVLEASYIIFLLPPFYKNYGKRITKSPKVYFYDTGLVAYLTGINNKELYDKGPMAGAIFENYLIAEILKRELHGGTHTRLYYYRSNAGVEVDLIVDKKSYKELIEIKKSSSFNPGMTASIEKLLEPDDKAFLLYNGREFQYLKNIRVINYSEYLLSESI